MIIISCSVVFVDDEIVLLGICVQGVGGQYVNKVLMVIYLCFDIKVLSLLEFYKECLFVVSYYLIFVDGVVIIKVQEYCSQEMNCEVVIVWLVVFIKELIVV